VEAQVQLGQQRDGGDDVLGEAQRLEPPADHRRPDHLVVVERHAAARLLAAGARLADVVQQRRQPQHQVRARPLERDGPLQHLQGVVVDVLVLVPLVDLEPQRGQLGQHLVGQPGVDQQLQAGPREAAEQQLGQLVGDPLDADDLEPLGHRPHRLDHLGHDGEAELAGEAGGPQHPQRVVAEGVLRPARGAQPLRRQVVQPAVRVDEGVRRPASPAARPPSR
jgi:hypothetical protein